YKTKFKKFVIDKQLLTEIKSPKQALKAGIVLVPEDRKSQGLVLLLDVVQNITLPNCDIFAPNFNIKWQKAVETTKKQIKDFNIKVSGEHQKVKNLSGGNQQKVVLAKFLLKKPK